MKAAPTGCRLDALCIDHIAHFKRPERYVRVDELPKSAAGKILKSELGKKVQAGVPLS
jgi:acyl-CoA synthetase (AMP-forming)/AMP-acid ligase II